VEREVLQLQQAAVAVLVVVVATHHQLPVVLAVLD
jgi:hypothetical protein